MQDKLWKQYAIDGDTEPLIEFFMGFAMSIARSKHKELPPFVLLEDLESSALVGLWKAVVRFDPARGTNFKSFAQMKILGAIIDDIREEDHGSRALRDKQKDIRRATQKLGSELGRLPDQEELADILGLDLETLQKHQRKIHEAKMISIDMPVGEEGSTTIGANISVEYDDRPIDINKVIRITLAPLAKREKLLIALRYFEDLTLDQCAPILRMTHPMVCQCHFRIADKLDECYKRALKKET